MTLDQITTSGINPALNLLPAHMDSPQARIMLLTIALQESRLLHRRQLVGNTPKPVGPAKSFWQGEKGGGMVRGVRLHAQSKDLAAKLYAARGVEPTDQAIWDAIENDDVLAAGLARLLLWTDPHKLPAINDVDGAWDLYTRVWRPGRPHIATWAAFHKQAREFVMEQ